MDARGKFLPVVLLGFLLNLARAEPYHDFGVYLAQHDYVSTPVDLSGTNRETIEAKVNGKSVTLLIDTGFGRTSLTANCARHLKLDVRDAGYQQTGVGGEVKGNAGLALISSFILNSYEINRLNTIVVMSKAAYTDGTDGFLGFDYLHLNAAIMPVGASVLLFKPGTRPVPPIDAYLGKLGFKAIPLHYGSGGLRVEGQLDGLPFTAIVDCGASFTTFDLDFVHQAKRMASSLPMKARGIDGKAQTVYGFTRKT